MQSLRAFRTVGAYRLQPAKDAPRRAKMAHVTYSTALSSDSSPRLYSSAFFAGPESWWLISANTSRNVRTLAEPLWSLMSLMSRRAESVPEGLVALVAPRWVVSMVPASATGERASLGLTLLAPVRS